MNIFTCKKSDKSSYKELSVNVSNGKITFTQYFDAEKVTINDDGSFKSVIEFDKANPESFKTVSFEFDVSALSTNGQMDSGSAWNIYIADQNKNPWFANARALSAPIRGNASDVFHAIKQEVPTAVVVLPYRNATLDQCFIGINIGESPVNITVDGSQVQATELNQGQDLDYVRELGTPKFKLELGPVAAGSLVDVTARVFKADGSLDFAFSDPVYFETTGGILAMTKVDAVAGVAKTRLRAADLFAGDSITVKVGTKFHTSLAKSTAQVST